MNRAERTVRGLLDGTGVELNGDRPSDLRVIDDRFYERVLSDGSIGFGEAYMDGWWECEALDVMIDRLLRADLESRVSPAKLILPVLYAKLVNRQRRSRAFDVATRHYDLGNELYRRMLDRRMTYTCGYWEHAEDLDQAQEHKLDLTCRKMELAPGMRVLDIGCGWGSFAGFAAERYGVEVVGVTVSKEQVELGREMTSGLPVDLRLQDYREVEGTYDRIVSLGMFEHVGLKNYEIFMQVVLRCLKDDGLFLLHTIGTNTSATAVDPWTDKHIFPGGMLPTAARISAAVEGRLVIEDWHNFGLDYDPTLMAWMANVDRHRHELQDLGYDERFYRMWRFFLLSSAGGFRARRNHLWQIVLSKPGYSGRYRSVRGPAPR
ncbi:MAG TPA: cyclopropane fatty acyl phospholipid synthase [Arenicellales bacterium]|nr:cyclopropane fatty acyl phospholipid synthase [Arenicellales bacterium]